MARVCSRHLHEDPDCRLCHTEPWELLGVEQSAWEAEVAHAESEGTMTCPLCGFSGMYRATCRMDGGEFLCPCCGRFFTEAPSVG